MTRQPLQHGRLQPPWWLAPTTLFFVIIGTTMVAATWQSDSAYRLYGTVKFVAARHLLLAATVIIAFSIGSKLANATGRKSKATPDSVEPHIAMLFWITSALCLFGYTIWLSVGIKNGFRLSTFFELLTTEDPRFTAYLGESVFNTIQGVTTCTQFGVAAVPMGIWLFFRGRREVMWVIAGLVCLAIFRALLFSERLAVIELLVPGASVALRMHYLGKKCARSRVWMINSVPLVGVACLVLFFGAFEYFRSWRYYHYEFDSYPEFVVWRVAGYYTTAHNNTAMALESRGLYPLPFTTVQSLWMAAGLISKSLRYSVVTGIDPDETHIAMLERYGTPELNNEGGLFEPALDYGLGGLLLFWFLCGFACSRAYKAYLAGNVAGILCYPLFFLSILETPRFLYLTYTRSLPAIAIMILVCWIAANARRDTRAFSLLPATA